MSGDGARVSRLCGGVVRRTKIREVGSVDMVNGGNRDAYMDATVLMLSVGADAMGASSVTMVGGVVVRAVVGMTMTGPAVTATSPPRDSRGDIVGGAS